MPSEALLRAEAICRVYVDGDVQALRNVSIRIDAGQYVSIVGPSGSGKSTLLNCLGGLDQPTSGRVFFRDCPIVDLRQLDRLRRQEIGYVFQSFYLLPTLTALENVQLPLFESKRSAAARADRAATLLSRVGMSHRQHHRPTELSVGERQRVAIARALANDPAVVLADEPTGNLDTKTGEGIMALFDDLSAAGVTLVVISHSPEVAARAARTVEMCDGELIRDSAEPVAVAEEPKS